MRYAKYIGVYDLTDDKERNQISKLLERYGYRIQKSVFELSLTRGTLASLEKELKKITLETGSLVIYHLDARAKKRQYGVIIPPEDNPLDDSHPAFIIS